METTQENFVLSIQVESPVVISIPHDGLQKEGLLSAFVQRTRGFLGREQHVSTIANDVNRHRPVASIVRGLLPRAVCDYNRAEEGVEDVAYVDQRVAAHYRAYHDRIGSLLQQARRTFGRARLLDLHGCGGPYLESLVLGSRNGSTCRDGYDTRAFEFFSDYDLSVHLARIGEKFSGGHTVAHHSSESVSALQIEIGYQYRAPEAKQSGQILSDILADFIENAS